MGFLSNIWDTVTSPVTKAWDFGKSIFDAVSPVAQTVAPWAGMAADYISGEKDRDMYTQYATDSRIMSDEQLRANFKNQRQFAQKGIRWRVQDAKKAGLHPLAALGANIASPSPVTVGGAAPPERYTAKMGQDITRAIQSTFTGPERTMQKLTIDQEKEKLKQMKLETGVLTRQVRDMDGTPPMPDNIPDYIPGQPSTKAGTRLVPDEQVISKQRGVTAATKPFYSDVIDDQGNIWRMPSKEISEVLESSLPDWIRHTGTQAAKQLSSWWASISDSHRQRLSRQLRSSRPPSPTHGYEYRYNLGRGQWRLVKIKNRSYLIDHNYLRGKGIPYRGGKSH